jgi:hypothetical protein
MAYLRWLAAVGATTLTALLLPAAAWAHGDGAELARRRVYYGRGGFSFIGCCCLVVVLVIVGIVYLIMRSRRRPPPPPPPGPPPM